MADIAHISGLVATQEAANPFEYCDVVTTTSHKTLRGPRAGIIFFKKGKENEKTHNLESRVNQAVFPGCQGGPHNHCIAALATALHQVATPEFKQYIIQVKKNAVALADALTGYGYKMVSGGTENHLVLWDLRPSDLTGSKLEKVCDLASITLNKNTVQGDVSALSPGGVRVGAPALTSRDFKESDFVKVAEFLHKAVHIALKIQEQSGRAMKDFTAAAESSQEILGLKKEVETFASKFPFPC